MNKRSKAWAFTIFNYDDEIVSNLREAKGFNETTITHLFYGFELTRNDKPHLQGYIKFNNEVSLKATKEILGATTAHLEPARMPMKNNFQYCLKTGSYEIIYFDEVHIASNTDMIEVDHDI